MLALPIGKNNSGSLSRHAAVVRQSNELLMKSPFLTYMCYINTTDCKESMNKCFFQGILHLYCKFKYFSICLVILFGLN